MSDQNNPYLRRQEEKNKARQQWYESEWLLNHLRSDTGLEQKIVKDEEILQWEQQLH